MSIHCKLGFTCRAFVGLQALLLSCLSGCAAPQPQKGGTDSTSSEITAQPDLHCSLGNYDSHEYWFCDDPRSFQQAEAKCAAVGTSLVRLDSLAENSFVRTHTAHDSWLGAVKPSGNSWSWSQGNEIFWVGGSTGTSVASLYSHWDTQEPSNNGSKACATLDRAHGAWEASSCSSQHAFVCESTPATDGFPHAPDAGCFRSTFNGHDYWFCSPSQSFAQARANCNAIGMDLVEIGDTAENAFVRQHLASNDSYIGLADPSHEGHWKWGVDGRLAWCGDEHGRAPGESAYANWGCDQPRVSSCSYETRNGHGYWMCGEPATWDEARTACESAGMKLVGINDAGEDSFLRGRVQHDTWTGGSDQSLSGQWHWADGSLFWASGHPVTGTYSHWNWSQPRNGNRDCLVLDGAPGGWRTETCSKKLAWMCETPTTGTTSRPEGHDCATISRQDGKWQSSECAQGAGYVCETVNPDADKTLDQLAKYLRDDYRAWKPRVSDVTFKDNSAIEEPFLQYGDRLGFRECIDSAEPKGIARPTHSLQTESLFYNQVYKGIPVYSRGYGLQRDVSMGVARSFTGQIEHSINVDINPSFAEFDAYLVALHSIGGNSHDYSGYGHRPHGDLAIYPVKQGVNSKWELSWMYTMPSWGARHQYNVVVSAKSGALISQSDGIEYANPNVCGASIVTGSPAVAEINPKAWQQVDWNDPSLAEASASNNALFPYLLYAQGLGPEAPGGLSSHPRIYARCDETPDGQATNNKNIRWAASIEMSTWDPYAPLTERPKGQGEEAAIYFMTAQRCLEYFADTFTYASDSTAPLQPWVGLDGKGEQDVIIRLDSTAKGPSYDPADKNIYCNPASSDIQISRVADGASIEIVCHEMGHGLWHAVRDPIEPLSTPGGDASIVTMEAKALNEGFGDVIGAGVELAVRGLPGHGPWCALGDANYHVVPPANLPPSQSCARDFAHPELSVSPFCTVRDANGQPISTSCTGDYGSPDYCSWDKECKGGATPVLNECCDQHQVSLVLSHWFYLLANGFDGVNSSSCAYHVTPLNADPEQALKVALNIALETLKSPDLSTNGGYQAFANETKTITRDLFGPSSEELKSVVNAWYAVNVVEESWIPETMASSVNPAREAQNVYPWAIFSWPRQANETVPNSWDIQISTGQFDVPDLIYERSHIGTPSTTLDGKPVGRYKLTLPFNTSDRYFWRVRPSTGNSTWTSCYPIHSFVGTREPDPMFPSVHGPIAADGKVRPGRIVVQANGSAGANKFIAKAATHSIDCDSTGGDILEVEVSADAFPAWYQPGPNDEPIQNHTFYMDNFQPEEHYWLSVRGVGPDDLSGNPSLGPCGTIEFDTTSMRPPVLLKPQNGGGLYYTETPSNDPDFLWAPYDSNTQNNGDALENFDFDGAISFHVRFYEVDENGVCSTTVAKTLEAVPQAIPSSPSKGTLDKDALGLDPNPTGYCWNVVSVASNGGTSVPSETRRVHYVHPEIQKLTGEEEIKAWDGVVHALPGDSYASGVTFEWQPSTTSNLYGWGLKIGKWPWHLEFGAITPANDVSGLEDPYEVTEYRIYHSLSSFIGELPAKSSMGRYCWTVWPIVADPSSHEIWSRQYSVETGEPYCYNGGPSKPVFHVDPPANGSTYVASVDVAIHGTLKADYIPDGQLEAFSDHPEDVTWDTSECKPWGHNFIWYDYYDCLLKFTITPHENTTYHFTAQSWNETVRGARDYQLPDVTLLVPVAACGHEHEDCCPGTGYDQCTDGSQCLLNNKCELCGEKNLPCCNPTFANDPNNDGCGNTSTCQNGTCRACGEMNGACCPGGTCKFSNLTCNGGFCEGPTLCSQTVQSGSLNSAEFDVEMGTTQGSNIPFVYRSFNVPDHFVLTYDSTTIFDSLCISTNELSGPQTNFASCSNGTCSVLLNYPANAPSTKIHVQVDANCGGADDNLWEFSLACP